MAEGQESTLDGHEVQRPVSRPPIRENILGYDVVKAASAYSNATGLVSGFALAAVVLVFTIAATVSDLDDAQRVDLGFATSLFALGFVGCLLGAYAFASLGGEENSPATMTYSMLVGSAVSIAVIAVLGGFEALAEAFLAESAVVFEIFTAMGAAIVPLFVWFPQWDIVQRFGPPRYDGPPRSTAEAERLIRRLGALGLLAAAIGTALHFTALFGDPERWEYLVLTFGGLLYVGAMVATALKVSMHEGRGRATTRETWVLAIIQSLMVMVTLALLP
ncbi:MAG TPA: hypothetical protein VFJ61_10935 [Solirubrobacterales bacterium]|nr:hypothetical protein [Solirubrobacterales bacterium]